MSQGLEVWDENGIEIISLDGQFCKFLGTFQTGTVAGSMTDDRLSLGTPFFLYVSSNATWGLGGWPQITVSGTTISWVFGEKFGTDWQNWDTLIAYGVR